MSIEDSIQSPLLGKQSNIKRNKPTIKEDLKHKTPFFFQEKHSHMVLQNIYDMVNLDEKQLIQLNRIPKENAAASGRRCKL